LREVLSAITFGHSGHGGELDSGGSSKFLAQASPLPVVQSSGR